MGSGQEARAAPSPYRADGALDPRERRLLRNLREGLGLTREEAERLEDEAAAAERAPGDEGR